MDWLAYPLADIIVWTFDNLLVPAGEFSNGDMWFLSPNFLFLVLGFIGMFFWMWMQGKYNKAAKADANQLK